MIGDIHNALCKYYDTAYSFDKIVGGSCLSSPARMHFGALNTAIQQLGSIACRDIVIVSLSILSMV